MTLISRKWATLGLVLLILAISSLACNVTLTNPSGTTSPTDIDVSGTVATTVTVSPAPPVTLVTATPTTDNEPTNVVQPTASYVPATATAITPTVSPVPTVSLTAKVCATCVSLRVRQAPNTTSAIIVELPTNTSVNVTGRTTDGNWFRVVTGDGKSGWGYAPFITVSGDINSVDIVNVPTGPLPTAGPTAVAQVPASGAPLDGNIVTGITSKSRQIFLNGQSRGNLPGVFTRVGDSITAHPSFLHQFSGKYDLGVYSALSPAVSYFSGPNGRGANPFLAASLAERNFWKTQDVLDPSLAPSDICKPGETPLACEYRLVRPSVSLILIGTNDAAQGISPAQYQANMQRIVQISIDMGVIPVLSTLPPKHLDAFNTERVDQFNGIIVAVARANDIPLWNLWLALQNVPNQGISSDGVHLTTPPDGQAAIFDAEHMAYGYPVRNLTALQVLDLLRRQVLYGGSNNVLTPAPASGLAPGAGVPTPLPGVTGCNGAPLPRLFVGGKGKVTPGLPNKLRAGPHKNDTVIGSMQPGSVFSVIGGPVCGDGFRWWQVTYNGLNAWTADGQGSEYWLEPAS